MTSKSLILRDLSKRHPGLTEALAEAYHEAASVCLSRHHISPVEATIDYGGQKSKGRLVWATPSERTLRAWANETDATEAGAYCVSLSAVEVEKGFVAIARAHTLTGADYYVAPIGSSPDDLESAYRLEVSGTDAGGLTVVKARLNSKISQAKRGDSNLPAIAAVVGFKELAIAIADVDTQ